MGELDGADAVPGQALMRGLLHHEELRRVEALGEAAILLVAPERTEGQRLDGLAVSGDVDVPLVERVNRRQHAHIHRGDRCRRGAREQRRNRRQHARFGDAAHGGEACVVLLPELPAECIDEEQYHPLRARVRAAETIRRQQRPERFAGEQVMQCAGNVAEAVIGVDGLQQGRAERLEAAQRRVVDHWHGLLQRWAAAFLCF
jgi:hypothetical protein